MFAKPLHRHILSIILTPILVMCGWLVVSFPILLVFIIDDAFETSELLKFMFYAVGISLTICVLIAFPLTLLLEKVFAKAKVAIVLVSGFMFLVSVVILLRYIFSISYEYNIHPWTGQLLLFSFSFAIYWSVFWFPRLIKYRSEQLGIAST
jgi:hypothetical protein